MWQGSMSPGVKSKSTTARRWRIVCLLIAVLVPSIGGAQDSAGTTVMKSGLHSFFDGHSALLTVSETGTGKSLVDNGSSSLVTIEFRDDTDRQAASITGWLTHGQAGSAGDASSEPRPAWRSSARP